jgi:hypothetical protein
MSPQPTRPSVALTEEVIFPRKIAPQFSVQMLLLLSLQYVVPLVPQFAKAQDGYESLDGCPVGIAPVGNTLDVEFVGPGWDVELVVGTASVGEVVGTDVVLVGAEVVVVLVPFSAGMVLFVKFDPGGAPPAQKPLQAAVHPGAGYVIPVTLAKKEHV